MFQMNLCVSMLSVQNMRIWLRAIGLCARRPLGNLASITSNCVSAHVKGRVCTMAVAASVRGTPVPSRANSILDLFGNVAVQVSFDGSHRGLTVDFFSKEEASRVNRAAKSQIDYEVNVVRRLSGRECFLSRCPPIVHGLA